MFEIEHDFACPYCLAPITMLLDPSIPRQRYVEDCEVCCRPIEFNVTVELNGSVIVETRHEDEA